MFDRHYPNSIYLQFLQIWLASHRILSMTCKYPFGFKPQHIMVLHPRTFCFTNLVLHGWRAARRIFNQQQPALRKSGINHPWPLSIRNWTSWICRYLLCYTKSSLLKTKLCTSQMSIALQPILSWVLLPRKPWRCLSHGARSLTPIVTQGGAKPMWRTNSMTP